MLSEIVIVTVADSNFLPAACCTMISTKDKLSVHSRMQRLIVAVDVSEPEAEAADRFLSDHGVKARIERISSADFFSNSLRVDERISAAAYARLFLDRLLDPGVEKVLYLDADTRVMSSLDRLFAINLGEYPLAAVKDIYMYVQDRLATRNAILGSPSGTDYLNSGVMLLNWPEVLKRGLLQEAREFAVSYPEKCKSHDQDAINAAVSGDFKALDPRWNLIHYYFINGGTSEAWIKHYTGPKPWSRKRIAVWATDALWYRDLLAQSPWPDFFQEQHWMDRHEVSTSKILHWLRNYRRVAGNYLFPFFMSPEARKRARQFLSFDPAEVVTVTHSWMENKPTNKESRSV